MIIAKQKLLLVDDSKEDRFLIRQALCDCGMDCEIEEVSDGEQAEQRLSEYARAGTLPEFVILDLVLPKRSGIEVLERTSAHDVCRRTKVIILSSLLPEEDKARLRKMGVWQVFEKPIDLDEFLDLGRKVKALSALESPN